jgi:hypothetical protein
MVFIVIEYSVEMLDLLLSKREIYWNYACGEKKNTIPKLFDIYYNNQKAWSTLWNNMQVTIL